MESGICVVPPVEFAQSMSSAVYLDRNALQIQSLVDRWPAPANFYIDIDCLYDCGMCAEYCPFECNKDGS